MRLLKVSVCLLVVLTLTTAAFSQTATSSLRGTVMDPKGGVIPGATVTLKNASQGFMREVKTDDRGEYQFQQVPPATYDITATAANVGTLSQKGVRLLVGTPTTLDLTLKLSASTTVEVVATAPVVNTTDASIGTAFAAEKIQSLPIQDRRAENLLSLQPGVTYTGPPDNGVDNNFDSRNGAVAGARSDQANLTVDGIDNNDVNKGFAFTGALRTPVDSIQEFRVNTSNSNADLGRSSGAQITIVTKSGTNNLHGSLFEYHRPTFGVANDWFIKNAQVAEGQPNIAPKLIRNTFGGTIGGPIVKDRMFFFFNYEGQRTAETTTIQRVVPSDNLRQGIISYTCADDPTCPASGIQTLTPGDLSGMESQCVGNGTCPWGPGVDPNALAVLQTYPHANNSFVTGTDGLNFQGFVFAAPTPARQNTFFGKLDFNLTANGNEKLFLRGSLQDDRQSNASEFPGLPPNSVQYDNSKGVSAGLTSILSPSLINNFRWGYVRQGIGTAGIGTQHHVTIRGLDNPVGFTRSSFVNVPLHNFQDDVTWSKGKHTLQFGSNWRMIFNNRQTDLNNYFSANTNPSWLLGSSFVGTNSSGGELDPGQHSFPQVDSSFRNAYNFPIAAITGVIAQFDTVYNQRTDGSVIPEGALIPRHYKSNEFEFYGQDQWRIKPNLTITAGLRYSVLQPPYERNGQEAAPTFSMNTWFKERQAAMFAGQTFNQPVTFVPTGKANGKDPVWNWDYNDLAPRFAVAYSPNFWQKLFGGPGKTSMRAGYGKYYDHFGEGIVNSFDQNGSFGLTTAVENPSSSETVGCAPRYTGLTGVPTTPGTMDGCGATIISAPPGQFPVTPPGGFDNGSFAIYWGLDDKLKTPYSHVFDASITRELPGGFVVETAYVGRLGRHLLQQLDLAMPLNIVDPSSHMDYYTAMTLLSKQVGDAITAHTPESNIAPIPYFENLFPTAAGAGGIAGCDASAPGSPTATQNMYDLLSCGLRGNETAVLEIADQFCFPGCATIGGVTQPYQYFNDQFSSLYAWSSIGTSSYHSGQLMFRHPMTHGVQFDFNYTYSKSMDVGSDAERNDLFTATAGGPQDNIIDSWHPKAELAVSTFDTTHQINANYVFETPFGKRRHFAMNAITDAFLGGWDLSGVMRWTSGFPFAINNGANWATNWELSGYSPYRGAKPSTGVFRDACGAPTVFVIPGPCVAGQRDSTAVSDFINNSWRFSYAGEAGPRNSLRGPGYFGWDMGLGKTWKLTESKTLKFSWEVFNVFNNVRFDALTMQSSIDSSGSFGTFSSTLTSPRKMQFGLHFDF